MSARTRAAVRRVEEQHLHLDAVADSLATIRRKLREPGRWLRFSEYDYYCGVFEARDRLREALFRLPPQARADLGRIVARLDAEFERRTLPDVHVFSACVAGSWWWLRNTER